MKCMYLTFLTVLTLPTSAISQSSLYGTVQLYDDGDCTLPRGQPVSLAANSCLETNQAAGIAALSFPSCGTLLYISDTDQCRQPTFSISPSSGAVGECLSLVTGASIGSAAFICTSSVTTASPAPTSQESSTPLSTPSPVTPLSTPIPTTTSHAPTSQESSTPSSTPSPVTPLSTPTPATASSKSTTTTTSASNPYDDGPSGGHLSRSDKITIAVGVSIGLVAIIIGIIQLTPQRIRWTRHGDGDQEPDSDPDPPPYQRFQEFELYHQPVTHFAGLVGRMTASRTGPRT